MEGREGGRGKHIMENTVLLLHLGLTSLHFSEKGSHLRRKGGREGRGKSKNIVGRPSYLARPSSLPPSLPPYLHQTDVLCLGVVEQVRVAHQQESLSAFPFLRLSL